MISGMSRCRLRTWHLGVQPEFSGAALVVMACTCGVCCAKGADVTSQASGAVSFDGSTIVSTASDFQADFIYRVSPPDSPIVPQQAFSLSVGAVLDTAASSVEVTLSVDPGSPSTEIVLQRDTATFVPQSGLYHNYDPAEAFEIVYTGSESPFVGPVDFTIEPAGMDPITFRAHFAVVERTGYPVAVQVGLASAPGAGDIAGDEGLEIVVPGTAAGQMGLLAFDTSGGAVTGWPFVLEDPDIVSQVFGLPVLVDLDGDTKDEIVVVGYAVRNVAGQTAGTEVTKTLYALDGAGVAQWQVDGDFESTGAPAVADLDGDDVLDIVVPVDGNLHRFDASGAADAGWQVAVPSGSQLLEPVVAELDSNAANGLEIVGCGTTVGPPAAAEVYAWHEDGSPVSGWPIVVARCVPLVVVDLDGDAANGLEVLAASDHGSDPPVDPDTGFLNTFSVEAWHADGTPVAGWPVDFMRSPGLFVDDRIVAGPSAGDIDGDGDLEVVVGTYGEGESANGNLFVFRHDGTLDPNWPRWAGTAQTPSNSGGLALADLDGDGKLEIVTASFLGVCVFREDGSAFPGFPKLTGEVFAQPIVADMDRDGHADIIVTTLHAGTYAWRSLAPTTDAAGWPQFRFDAAHRGSREAAAGPMIPTMSEIGAAVMGCLLSGLGAIVLYTRRVRAIP